MAYGQLGTLQLAAQSSYGTLNVTSLRALPIVSETLKHTLAQLQEKALYGRFGDPPRHAGQRASAGTVTFEPLPTFLGTLLYAACGQVTTTVASSVSTHKFRPLNTADWDAACALPPFTALLNRDVAAGMAYFDLAAGRLTLEAAHGELLKGTVEWVGGNYSDQAKSAPALPNEQPWSWNQASASYGGAALGSVRKFSLSQQNRLAPVYLLGSSATPNLIKRSGPVEVSGQMTLVFQSNSLMADFLAQTERQLTLSFVSNVASPAALKIDVPNLRITDFGPSLAGPGLVELPLSWVADFEPNSGYQVEYTLTNTVPAYP
jgi:hypothetical protein